MQTSNTNVTINQALQMNSAQRSSYAATAKIKTAVSELMKGDILKGEVIDLRGHNIQILLSDGQQLKATFDSSLPLFIGDNASFLVEENSTSSLVLKLLQEPAAAKNNATIDKALEEASLPKSDKNITVVQELLKNQMSINKNSITDVLRQSATFRNASIETLVLMNKYKIPMTESTTTQLEAYRNYEFRLIQQAKELTQTIETAMQQLPKDSKLLEDFTSFLKNSLAIFPEDTPAQALPIGNENLPSDLEGTPFETTSIATMPETIVSPPEDSQQTIQTNQSRPAEEQTLPQLNNQEESQPRFTVTIDGEQSIQPMIADDTILQFEALMRDVFTLPLHKLAEPESITKFYHKLERNLDEINSFFSKVTQGLTQEQKDNIQAQTNNMKDNVDFMKTINQLFCYVQLPMKLPNKDVHSELFVYTNKKNLQSDQHKVSVLLHLDMTHLGPIDFHLTLDDRQVTAKISLEDNESLNLVEQHLPELEKRLEEKGYQMTYQMEKLEKETKVIKDALESNSDSMLMRRYSFDLRA